MLSERLANLLMGITPEDHQVWMGHPCTKLLLATLDYDISNRQFAWMDGQYSKKEGIQNQAQCFYALGLLDDIRHMLREKQEILDGSKGLPDSGEAD